MTTHNLVAHFLKEHGYSETLRAFEREHGRPLEAALSDGESLVEIVEDRRKFRQLAPPEEAAAELAVARALPHWSAFVGEPRLLDVGGLVVASCLVAGTLLVSTATADLYCVDLATLAVSRHRVLGRVVVRKIVNANGAVVLVGMDGSVNWAAWPSLTIERSVQAHAKLVTHVEFGLGHVVTMGWDQRLKVFAAPLLALQAETTLAAQGACFTIAATEHGEFVVVGKNDHTLLEVYSLATLALQYKILLNDAVFNTAAFTPRLIVARGAVLVVATSHEPYMRLIVVSLTAEGDAIRRNQIVRNINTMSPQDKYLQAVVAWRADASGIWVAGDDGVVRGVDLQLQKVVAEFAAHEGKIKTLCAGRCGSSEVLVTSGTDRVVKLTRD